MGAGLGGLFVVLVLLGMLPVLLAIQIGWWVGKRAAFRNLTMRNVSIAVLLLMAIELIFWHPSVFRLLDDKHQWPGPFFGIEPFLSALKWVLIPAGLAAAMSWALNVDSYHLQRKQREANPLVDGEPGE